MVTNVSSFALSKHGFSHKSVSNYPFMMKHQEKTKCATNAIQQANVIVYGPAVWDGFFIGFYEGSSSNTCPVCYWCFFFFFGVVTCGRILGQVGEINWISGCIVCDNQPGLIEDPSEVPVLRVSINFKTSSGSKVHYAKNKILHTTLFSYFEKLKIINQTRQTAGIFFLYLR